jgi:hypothetical protein
MAVLGSPELPGLLVHPPARREMLQGIGHHTPTGRESCTGAAMVARILLRHAIA